MDFRPIETDGSARARRTLLLILGAVCGFSVLALDASALTTTLTGIPAETLSPGDTFTVEYHLDNVGDAGLYSLSSALIYDSSVLQLKESWHKRLILGDAHTGGHTASSLQRSRASAVFELDPHNFLSAPGALYYDTRIISTWTRYFDGAWNETPDELVATYTFEVVAPGESLLHWAFRSGGVHAVKDIGTYANRGGQSNAVNVAMDLAGGRSVQASLPERSPPPPDPDPCDAFSVVIHQDVRNVSGVQMDIPYDGGPSYSGNYPDESVDAQQYMPFEAWTKGFGYQKSAFGKNSIYGVGLSHFINRDGVPRFIDQQAGGDFFRVYYSSSMLDVGFEVSREAHFVIVGVAPHGGSVSLMEDGDYMLFATSDTLVPESKVERLYPGRTYDLRAKGVHGGYWALALEFQPVETPLPATCER